LVLDGGDEGFDIAEIRHIHCETVGPGSEGAQAARDILRRLRPAPSDRD
jgi:hypothetical protein